MCRFLLPLILSVNFSLISVPALAEPDYGNLGIGLCNVCRSSNVSGEAIDTIEEFAINYLGMSNPTKLDMIEL